MADKKKTVEEKVRSASVALPIEWHYPEGLLGRFATHLVAQQGEHEFHLSFFEIKPPVLLGSAAEQKEQMAALQSVRAECVARVVVAKEKLPDVIKVLTEIWEAANRTTPAQHQNGDTVNES